MTNKSTLAQGLSHAWPWTKPIGSSPTTSRLLRYSLLCMLILLCGGSAWAEDKTYTHTFKAISSVGNMNLSDVSWNLSITWSKGESFQSLNDSKGAQIGSGSKPATNVTFTTSAIPGQIKSVKVNASVASQGTTTLSVSVGGTAYKSSENENVTLQTSAADYTFTPGQNIKTGEIIISFNQPTTSKAIYIKSIEVIYNDGNSAVTPTMSFPLESYSAVLGEGFTSPALTYNGDGTVTYTSNKTDVAEVDANTGAVTTKAYGTATITASAAATANYTEASASYTLAVHGATEDGIFNFSTNNDYGSGYEQGSVKEQSGTWTAGNVTMALSGRNCWFTDGTLRIYKPDTNKDNNGKMTFSVPSDKAIKGITISGSKLQHLSANGGTYSLSSDNKTATWIGNESSVVLTLTGTDNAVINTITVTYGDPSINLTTPTFDPAEGTYYGTQTVAISCETSDAEIYYSTDNENFNLYSSPIEVSESKTIYAYSQVGVEKSATVSAKYTIGALYTTIQAMQEAATSTATTMHFTPTSTLQIVYVKSDKKNAYLVDESGYGLLIYNSNGLKLNGETDFAAGQVLSGGTIMGALTLYNGNTEITDFTTEDVTITTAEVTPVEKTLPLTNANQSTLVTLKGLTYNAETSTFSNGENTIKFYDSFSASPTLEDGKTYDVTGIVVMYNTTIEICPRTADDVTEAAAPAEDTYVVAGGFKDSNEQWTEGCFGTQWAPTLVNNQLVKQDNGTYSKTYENVEIAEKTTIEYKICTNGQYPEGENKWYYFEKAGTYDITFTYDPNATGGDGITMTATLKYESVYAVGDGLGTLTGWSFADDNKLTESTETSGVYSITYNNVPASEAVFKFALDRKWDHNFGGTKDGDNAFSATIGTEYDAVYEGANISITTTETSNITLTLDLSNFDFNTKQGAKFTITSEPVEVPVVGFRDIKVTLNDADMWQNKINSSGAASTVYITVDAEGNIGTTENADEAAATLKGYWHGAQYGWQKFSAEVPVKGCVKITLGASNYGSGAVIVTDSENNQVATIDNHTGAMWSTSDPDNVAVGYYRTNKPTTLTFSQCDYIPYFAVEAIAEEDLPEEVTTYKVTFAAGEGVQGVAPAAVEVEAGGKVTIPANYTLYKEGYTLTGWNDGTNDYAAGAEITPEADMTLYAVFTENTVNLADHTETVSISWALGQKSGDEGVEYNGNKGVVVTRAAVNNKRIDAKLDVDATNGKFYNKRNDELAMINANTKLTVPACKGAIVTVKAYATGYNLTIDGTAMTDNGDKTYTYTVADEKESIDIIPAAQVYLSFVNVTLPVVDGSNLLYTWESPTGNPVETGGTIAYVNGEGDRLNYLNNGYYTICLNGKKANINDATPSANAGKMVITLDKALHEGDKINMTAYITNSASKTASAYVLFETGTSIDGKDYSDAANIGFATPGAPTTTTITVPKAAAGSKTITLTRSKTGTNLFITKLVITTTAEDDPNAVATPEITPATGTYTTDQEVAITCETEGATIYYTTDGNDPTAESTEYTEAFTVSETTTVKAIAIKGENSSEIAESVITIVSVQPGTSDLIWDYTETAPASSPDNGLTYDSKVNDATQKGVKLNGSGYAWFTKNPVAGKLTLTFGKRGGTTAYAVYVYSCNSTGEQGDLIGEIAVSESPSTGSLDIPATVTGIRIVRKTPEEGVLSKIVFKETVPRTFQGFEITNEELKGTYDPSGLPQGVEFSGTPHNDSHGYQNVTLTVPTDGGAVKFTIGGCQYANPATFDVKNSNSDVVATIDEKTSKCYHEKNEDISTRTVTYIYTGEATTLTFGPIAYLPYFKAEAVEVQEVTVTYKDQNGNELGKKTVFEGEAIGEIPYTETDLTIPEGEKFRGWVYASGVKVQATDIVSGSITVKASVTPIETVTEGSIQTYDLTKATFYPEDHETFDVDGAAWHDGQHGFVANANQSISVQTAGKAQVVVTLCQHSSEGTVTVKDANGNTVGKGFNAKVATCGTTAVVNYDGEEATWLTFTFSATAYIHSIKVYNVSDFVEKDEESGWYIVPANDGVGLVLALNAASQEADGANIFLPNGTYDLGESTLTPISGTNVSIIGESMEGVIIKNAPPVANEGLKTTATLHNTGENLYLQDLTIQNALDYYSAGSAGRGIAFWDEGKHTIAKNVKLLSYQDTYLSTVNQQFYWETSEIHGAVDFICGGSDVFFESTKIVTESRAATGKSGEATITAPQPGTQEQFGYVFNNCTIENNAAKFNLGRAWGGNNGNGPKQAYLNTTIMQPDEIISTRFTTAGMNEAAKSFKEYNSMNNEGTVISPTSNILKFTHSTGNYEYETILSETEAANYALDKVFTSWTPATYTKQVAAPKAELKDGVITWEKVDGATAYAIFKDGKFLGITTENTWTVEEEAAPAPRRTGEEAEATTTGYTIRAANSRGGFGEPVLVSYATGIAAIEAELGGDVKIYDLNGRRVMTPTKGVYIINGKKTIIK